MPITTAATTPTGTGLGQISVIVYLIPNQYFNMNRQEIIVLIVEPSRKLAHLVVALPVVVGTKNVEIQET